MTIYSLDELLFLFGTSLLFHVHSNCCFLTCIQVSQEAGQVVWYSHLFQNFPQFIVIHTVKGIVNKAEIDVFLETSVSLKEKEGRDPFYMDQPELAETETEAERSGLRATQTSWSRRQRMFRL